MKATFNSLVFTTKRLAEVRAYYEDVLGLAVATFDRDGHAVPDADEHYVNFDLGGPLLGFETGTEVRTARVVLTVADLGSELTQLAAKGVTPVQARDRWAILRDPEGREVILECDDEEAWQRQRQG